MIYRIEKGVSDTPNKDNKFYGALENLLSASRHSYHLVIMNPKDAIKLEDEYNFGDSLSEELAKIKAKSMQLIPLLDSLSHYISINNFRGEAFAPTTTSNNPLDLELFSDNNYLQKAELLCENIDDCVFYQMIMKCLCSTHKFHPLIQLSFSNSLGGGATIFTQFENNIAEQKITSCIVDSDRKYRNGPVGGTAGGAPKLYDTAFYQIVVTECHEIENLLPIPLLKNHSHDCGMLADIIEQAEHQDCFDFLHYVDMKNGISKYNIRTYPSTFPQALLNSCLTQAEYECKNTDCKKKLKEKACDDCKVGDGFGSKLLPKVTDELKKMIDNTGGVLNFEDIEKLYNNESLVLLKKMIWQMIPYGIAKKREYTQ